MPLGVIFDEFLGFKFDFVGEFDIKPFDTWSDFGESLGFSNALFLSFWHLRASSARIVQPDLTCSVQKCATA